MENLLEEEPKCSTSIEISNPYRVRRSTKNMYDSDRVDERLSGEDISIHHVQLRASSFEYNAVTLPWLQI